MWMRPTILWVLPVSSSIGASPKPTLGWSRFQRIIMTIFERLAHQKAVLQGHEIHRLSLRIQKLKKVITTQKAVIQTLDDQIGTHDKVYRRQEAIINGLYAQIAKLQGVKA